MPADLSHLLEYDLPQQARTLDAQRRVDASEEPAFETIPYFDAEGRYIGTSFVFNELARKEIEAASKAAKARTITNADREDYKSRVINEALLRIEWLAEYVFTAIGLRVLSRGNDFIRFGRVKGDTFISVKISGSKAGKWTNFKANEYGGVLAMWAYHKGYDLSTQFGETLRSLGDFLGVDGGKRTQEEIDSELARAAAKKRADQQKDKLEAARKAAIVAAVKSRTIPLAGTIGETYLGNRGIHELPPNITAGFIPAHALTGVPHAPPFTEHPSIVFWCSDEFGTVVGGQRVLLDPLGNKADLGQLKSKWSFASSGGFPVRFPAKEGDDQRTILIAEGPETALALSSMTGHECWAVLSISNFRSAFAVVPEDMRVGIAAEHDEPGSSGAESLIKNIGHAISMGLTSAVLHPPTTESGGDWLDVLKAEGLVAAKAALMPQLDFHEPAPSPISAAIDLPHRVKQPEAEREESKTQARANMLDSAISWVARAIAHCAPSRELGRVCEELSKKFKDGEITKREMHRQRRLARKRIQKKYGLKKLPTVRHGAITLSREDRELTKLPAGLGKSTAYFGRKGQAGAVHIAGAGGVILGLSPTSIKAAESHGAYVAAQASWDLSCPSPRAVLIEGRNAENCRMFAQAGKAGEKGLHVLRDVCGKCPHSAQCKVDGFLSQEGELKEAVQGPDGAMIFASHSYGFLPLPGSVSVDAVIVDEACHGSAVEHVRLALEDIATPTLPLGMPAERQADLLADLVAYAEPLLPILKDVLTAALSDAQAAWQGAKARAEATKGREKFIPRSGSASASVTALRECGVTMEGLQAASGALRACLGSGLPEQAPNEPVEALAKRWDDFLDREDAGRVYRFLTLIEALQTELVHGAQETIAVRAEAGESNHCVHVWRQKETRYMDRPTQVLDATANTDLTEAVLGPMKVCEHDVQRRATVLQIANKSFSNSRLLASDGDSARCLVKDTIAALAPRGSLLLVATIPALQGLGFAHNVTTGLWTPPEELAQWHVVGAHFNSLRGRNDFQDFRTVVTVGRFALPVDALEDSARAFAAQKGQPITEIPADSSLPTRKATIVDRRGVGVEVNQAYHPCPLVEAMREQLEDAELAQAAERHRPINPEDDGKLIVSFGNTPICTPDVVIDYRDALNKGSALERFVRRFGFLPHSPSEARRLDQQYVSQHEGAELIWGGRSTIKDAFREFAPAWKGQTGTNPEDAERARRQRARVFAALEMGEAEGGFWPETLNNIYIGSSAKIAERKKSRLSVFLVTYKPKRTDELKKPRKVTAWVKASSDFIAIEIIKSKIGSSAEIIECFRFSSVGGGAA